MKMRGKFQKQFYKHFRNDLKKTIPKLFLKNFAFFLENPEFYVFFLLEMQVPKIHIFLRGGELSLIALI